MKVGTIRGFTQVLGEAQGYIPLPVRQRVINTVVDGPETPVVETAWYPTIEELTRMVNGEPIVVQLVGTGHPPIMLTVGDKIDG
jgi:hypothetical protein